jgi:preprotein translocase subunit SecE
MATAQVQDGNQGNFMQRMTAWPIEAKNYFQDLQNEMRLVTWPTWKQVRSTTTVVIISVFLFAAFFMVVDQIVESAIQKIFTTFSR